MNETANLSLPLVQAAQAQKHVTVNEALVRLDALVQLTLQSLAVGVPPVEPADGQAWGVPDEAMGAWAGQDGRIAIADNGGWVFATPRAGWRTFVVDAGSEMRHDGTGWIAVAGEGVGAVARSGAALAFHVAEFDHAIVAGGAQPTVVVIPSHAMVFGVTARVIGAITGTLSSWSLGAPGAPDRFGSGLGLGLNSHVRGVLGTPMTVYAPSVLELTPQGGVFAGGVVRLAVHYAELGLPDAV